MNPEKIKLLHEFRAHECEDTALLYGFRFEPSPNLWGTGGRILLLTPQGSGAHDTHELKLELAELQHNILFTHSTNGRGSAQG